MGHAMATNSSTSSSSSIVVVVVVIIINKKISIEIRRMWNMKCFVIPVITGATGIVNKGLKKYLGTIPGKYSIDSLQKTAVLGTSHIIKKMLQSET
jgi:hypothetical protein